MPCHGVAGDHQTALVDIGDVDLGFDLLRRADEIAVAGTVEHIKLIVGVALQVNTLGKDDGIHIPQHRNGLVGEVLQICPELIDAHVPIVFVGIGVALSLIHI